ncbi:MAG: heparinase II/III family protein [Pseudoprimorskyibacter sp.]|nr:heparinase II/III family protein [Pseudoprimorskyibacter sp.]
MTHSNRWRERWVCWRNKRVARACYRARFVTGFVRQPEPRTLGAYARGRQLLSGNLHFAGMLVQAPGATLWEVAPPDPAWEEELHSFAWLDDLAAVPEPVAAKLAQTWVWGWLNRFATGQSALAWEPGLAGQRLMRCVQHASILTAGRSHADIEKLLQSLGAHVLYLNKRWHVASVGSDRLAALSGLVYGALLLRGKRGLVAPAQAALGAECVAQIDAQGGLPTRNPEELLEVFTLLTWVQTALDDQSELTDTRITRAISRLAPTLRSLRHTDGGLARFHGGGRGAEGRLELALAASPVKKRQTDGLAMGFARLSAGRSSVIIDAAPPPQGLVSLNAHASTLAFELTSGRRPVIVNCGSGAVFGEAWRRAGRATPSHSTLAIEEYSSARLGAPGLIGAARREMLEDTPGAVPIELYDRDSGRRFEGAHSGYVSTHGLTHARLIELSHDGAWLDGEDLLLAMEDDDKRRFDQRKDETLGFDDPGNAGVVFALRFHLHPDVEATESMEGIELALRSGERWLFSHESDCEMTQESSVYLEKARLRPRGTGQIVLSGRAIKYATRIRWSLKKVIEGTGVTRDFARDDTDHSL